jgi:hypothetical protein
MCVLPTGGCIMFGTYLVLVINFYIINVDAFSLINRNHFSLASMPESALYQLKGGIASHHPTPYLSTNVLYMSSTLSNDTNETAVLEEDGDDEVDGESISATVAEASSPSTTITTRTIQDNLSFLQTLGAITGRGEFMISNKNRSSATQKQYDAVMKVISELEEMNPTFEPTLSFHIYGTWELVLSTTQLFRSSPFFMAGRAVCTNDVDVQRYNWFCDMHRAALSVSTIQSVRQIVTPSNNQLVSELEVMVGAIPFLSDLTPFRYSGGLPLSITGAIVSTADITPTSDGTGWEIHMDTVEIKGSNVPVLRQILDNENVQLRSRSLASVLEQAISSYSTPKQPVFRTTYLDDKYRVSRDEDDNIFFYVKTSNNTTPMSYDVVDADLGIGRLLEGFNDAVTKFYI